MPAVGHRGYDLDVARESRETRLRRFLDEMTHSMLRSLGVAMHVRVTSRSTKDELIELLAEFPLVALRNGVTNGIAHKDLRALCARLGYSDAGSPSKLAGRLFDAIETPSARITRWRKYEDARAFARSLELLSAKQWYQFMRGELSTNAEMPDDIPVAPYAHYAKSGWRGWGDFLGTDNPARHLIAYRPFTKARAYVRSLGLADAKEWRELCGKRVGNRRVLPVDIPSGPGRVYKDSGWVSFGDWLGNDHVHGSKIAYCSYAQARAFVRALGIRNEPEWRAYCRGEVHHNKPRPIDVPTNPNRQYKNRGWITWGEFLGTGSVALYKRTFRSYKAAREYVRKQRIADTKEWRTWCAAGKRPPDIPGAPDRVYKGKGWTSWGEFLGSDNVHAAHMKWKSIAEAQRVVRRLGIRSRAEFFRAKKSGLLPPEIPITIERRPGWKGWPTFLAT